MVAVAPWLPELPGVGPISAAQVLVSWSRTAEGKSSREIPRCLKRAVARQLFKLLERHDRPAVEVIRA